MTNRLNFPGRLLYWLLLPFPSLVLMGVLASSSQAQNPYKGTTPQGMAPGAAAGSFPLSGFEDVNLYNGNLNVHLPLLQVGGRGTAQYTMTLRPVQASWVVQHQELGLGNSYNYPSYEWWSGLQPGYGPGVLQGRRVTTPCQLESSQTDSVTRLTFTGADGTEYELRDKIYDGEPLWGPCTEQYPQSLGTNRGREFTTSDGAATFISDTDLRDWYYPWSANFYPSGYLMLADGTRYRIDLGGVSWIRDRNGNQLSFGSANGSMTVTDSLNRVVTVTEGVQDVAPYGLSDKIVYKGFGGTDRTIRVSRAPMSTALRDGEEIMEWYELFSEIWGAWTAGEFNPMVVTKVWLPDGRSYQFLYNSYGEIARIVLPTGGAIEYDYGPGTSNSYANGLTDLGWDGDGPGSAPYQRQLIYRRVAVRRTYPNGGTGVGFETRSLYGGGESQCGQDIGSAGVWDYAWNGSPEGELIRSEVHWFHGSPCGSTMRGSSEPTRYNGWKEGKAYQIRSYGADGTELRRVVNQWQQRSQPVWEQHLLIPEYMYPSNGSRIFETTTTLEPTSANLVSRQTFSFDDSVPFNNKTDVYEFEYGVGSSVVLVRRRHTDYITAPEYVNGNIDPALGPHLRTLVSGEWISSDVSGNNKVSLTSFEYDNYSSGVDYHAALEPRSDITGLCTRVISPVVCDNTTATSYLKRGNVTAVTRSILTNGLITGSISSHQQYDVAGNIIKTIDPSSTPSNIVAATFDFSDRFGSPDHEAQGHAVPSQLGTLKTYAFATKVTNAMGHVAYSQYDYFLGAPVNTEDPNHVVSSMEFGKGGLDLLDRPNRSITAINTAIKRQSEIVYDDVNRIVTTFSDRVAYGDNILKSETLYDGFGRSTESRAYEGSSQYIATRQEYGSLGRVSKTSNPYRQGQNPVWTNVAYDALGRPTSVTTPDGASVYTLYNGARTLVTDQTGRQRISQSDALGRLTEIWEVRSTDGASGTEPVSFPIPAGVPVPSPSAGYKTTYKHDALGYLRKVSQGAQQRFFMYDSLGRLLRAKNPEQENFATDGAFLAVTDGSSGTNNSEWSIGYIYDANGNLKKRKDARNIVTDFEYDALNRSIGVDHSDTATNPDISRAYDNSDPEAFGIGRLWYSYAGGDESNGTTAEHIKVSRYDALGRALDKRQRFKTSSLWSDEYKTVREYNLAGSVTSQEYPSGNAVAYAYDDASRLTSFTGNLGDGAERSYSTGIIYSPMGGITKEQFGTDTPVFHKLAYNSRGQLAEIRTSTSYTGPADIDSNRGAIFNQYSLQCSGAGCNATDNNGNLRKQEVLIPHDDLMAGSTSRYQQFEYDDLNRLTEVNENAGGSQLWRQSYTFDRYGNRSINQSGTTQGIGINSTLSVADPIDNRLYAPGENKQNNSLIKYDDAGNQTKDHYSDPALDYDRTYDAENRMKTSTATSGTKNSIYTYNADGQRVRRNENGVETWQVYGIDGELLAEYAKNAANTSPQKEYGYRNGQLLITADAPIGAPNTVLPSLTAAPANNHPSNGVALSWSGLSGATNYRVERKDANNNWAKITSTASTTVIDNGVGGSGTAYLYQVCAADGLDNCTSGFSNIALASRFNFPTDPTLTTLVEDPSGANLTSIKAAHINELRTAINAVRILAGRPVAWTGTTVSVGNTVYKNDVQDLRDKLDEALMALGIPTQTYTDSILAGAPNGTPIKAVHIRQLRDRASRGHSPGVKLQPVAVTASNSHSLPYGPTKAVDGNPGTLWSAGAFAPQWIQLDLGQLANVSKIRLLVDQSPSGQTTHLVYGGPAADNLTLLGTFDGSTSFGQWLELNSTATGVRFVKIQTTASPSWVGWAEIEVYGVAASTLAQVNWLVADHLGTPRMVFDQSGSLTVTQNGNYVSGVKRHDYLPFGEELVVGQGGRGIALGFAGDTSRQKFTSKERDIETGLDYFLARYLSSTQGRFTSPDEFSGGPRELFYFADSASANPTFYSDLTNPQSLNKYQYAYNNPLRFIDPDGHDVIGYKLLTSGPNQVPEQDKIEVSDAATLGFKDTPRGGYALFNLEVSFDKGDNLNDYKHVRAAVILSSPTGESGTIRRGGEENPSDSQTSVKGQSRFVSDNPGVTITGTPKAGLNGTGLTAVFAAGEFNKKTGKLSENVAYYGVKIAFGKDGKIDVSKSLVTQISRDQFIKLAKQGGASVPKKDKKDCPECLLSPPN